jgi:hypothetical protein
MVLVVENKPVIVLLYYDSKAYLNILVATI